MDRTGDTAVLAYQSQDGYKSKVSLNLKVLDFIKSGGPKLTEGSTIFELVVAMETTRSGI